MGLGIAAGVAAGAAIVGPPVVVAAAPVMRCGGNRVRSGGGRRAYFIQNGVLKSQDASTVLLSPSTPPEAKSEATGFVAP